jgi:tetratricopeptide (TPR) repeat protein
MTSSPSSAGGPVFAGHVVTFSGKLASIGRREAQALIQALGGEPSEELTARTTILVVGDSAAREEDTTRVRRAEQANAKTPDQIRIISETEFCRLAGIASDNSLRRQFYGVRDIRSLYPNVTDNHLRYLEKWGLIRRAATTRTERFYTFSDLATIKQLASELDRNVPLKTALRVLMAEREGQLELDFHASVSAPAKVVALPSRPSQRALRQAEGKTRDGASVTPSSGVSQFPDPQAALAAKYFVEGSRLDDGNEQGLDLAAAAYRKALVIDPDLVPAIVNLANIHYARDELIEAQALYERAIGLDPECFEAHFNLGNIHHDLGRYGDALVCYRDAVALNPGYADAHFYLAVTLEKTGHSPEAKPHWKTYQDLAPNGEWVELAREFSE